MSSTGTQSFGQIIEADARAVWQDIEQFGEAALEKGEALAENEVSAIVTASKGLLGNFVPQQIAAIKSWVEEFAGEVGTGQITTETATTAILNKDAAAEGSFLNSVASTGLSALVAAFIAAL